MEKSNLLLPNNNFQYLEDINKNTEFKMCMNNLIEYWKANGRFLIYLTVLVVVLVLLRTYGV